MESLYKVEVLLHVLVLALLVLYSNHMDEIFGWLGSAEESILARRLNCWWYHAAEIVIAGVIDS